MTRWPDPILDTDAAFADAEPLAARARAAVAATDEAVRMNTACQLARARIRVQAISVAGRVQGAVLLPSDPGFTIFLSPSLRRHAATRTRARRLTRFVLAHELGHTFFYRPGRRPTRARRPDAIEESFCHRFATSLLVPSSMAARAPLTPEGLHTLASRYDVPLFLAARAMVRLRPDVSILWLRYGSHPHTGDRPTMRVQWGAGHRFFARGESLKSPVAMLPPGEHASSTEVLQIASRREELTLEAWRFREGSMLAFLHHAGSTSDATTSPQQLKLTVSGSGRADQFGHQLRLFG